jgi:Transposase
VPEVRDGVSAGAFAIHAACHRRGGRQPAAGDRPVRSSLCLLNPDGTLLLQHKVPHDVAGFAELDRLLTSTPKPAIIAIERGEGILVEHLLGPGLAVYCVSPKISALARERYRLAATKSDTFDAFVLADTLRHEHQHWRPMSNPSPILAELRPITRDRERIIGLLIADHPILIHDPPPGDAPPHR